MKSNSDEQGTQWTCLYRGFNKVISCSKFIFRRSFEMPEVGGWCFNIGDARSFSVFRCLQRIIWLIHLSGPTDLYKVLRLSVHFGGLFTAEAKNFFFFCKPLSGNVITISDYGQLFKHWNRGFWFLLENWIYLQFLCDGVCRQTETLGWGGLWI